MENAQKFDELFEENDDWIVTKNEDGEIKVASCKSDETVFEKERDWIVRKSEVVPNPGEFSDNFKIARFFISDLLSCEKTFDYFICKQVKFKLVSVCGMFTSSYLRNRKYFITVDDGTGNILAILEEDYAKEMKECNRKALAGATEQYKACKSNLLKACLMMSKSTNHILDAVPIMNELNLGDNIKLIGRITEFNGSRNIFIIKMIRVTSAHHSSNLENLLELYANIYKND